MHEKDKQMSWSLYETFYLCVQIIIVWLLLLMRIDKRNICEIIVVCTLHELCAGFFIF